MKIPLLVVCGPTAVGKTRLAVDLAERFGGEIVSADSMQIYKGMEIGTAKPTVDEMRGVRHHLIDFLEPDQSFSVADYVRLARAAVADIDARGHLPVLTGGTGLYIRSLIDNIRFDETAGDPALREELHILAAEKGAEALWEELKRCDPELAAALHPNNQGRIIRALEVYRLTGTTMSEHQRKSRAAASDYRLCMLGLCCEDRQKLYARINDRVDDMLARGLLEEARRLREQGISQTAAQAIGYKELFAYLDGAEPLEAAVDTLKRESRRYAKRQMTWLRRDERVEWLAADAFEDYAMLLKAASLIAESYFTHLKREDAK